MKISKQLLEKCGIENTLLKSINENTQYEEYEILYGTEEETDGKEHCVVEYDPSSNRPFMVYQLNLTSMEYELYSGEDTLDTAISVCNNI